MEIVIDTNIAIEILRGNLNQSDFENKTPYLTLTSIFELFRGTKESEIKSLRAFIANIPKLPQTELTMEIAALLKNKLVKIGLELPNEDIFIAANCLEFGLPLLTTNKKHFERIKELVLL
jgi:tRNA(fMet)-specific endonuclease VapC